MPNIKHNSSMAKYLTEETPTVPPPSSIGRYLRHTLLILRFMGSHPFSILKRKDGQREFGWKLVSWSTLFSGCSVISFHILFALWMSHYMEGIATISFEGLNISSVEKFGLHIFPAVHPILASIFMISSILGTPTTVEIIQNWGIFETKFQHAFPSAEPPFHIRSNFQRKGKIIGIFMTGVMIFSTNDVSEKSCKFLEQLPVSKWIIPYICYIFGNFTWFTAVHSFFEDIKFVVMLRAISVALSQVLCQIKLQHSTSNVLKPWNEDSGRVNRVIWCDLVLHIRKQIKLTGRAMSFGHLLSILIMFITLCYSIFMAAMIFFFGGRNIVSGTTRKATMLCWIWGVKLILKAAIAERASKLEQEIANELRGFNDLNEDKMTRLEMSILINHLDSNPGKIHLGGILVLNASLLLQIVGQVTTYLVVLFQFHNMELSNSN